MHWALRRWSECLPALLESVELLQPLRDGLRRPIDNQAGSPFDARNIIVAEGLLLRSPLPEAVAELAKAVRARNQVRSKQQRHNRQTANVGQEQFLSDRESV